MKIDTQEVNGALLIDVKEKDANLSISEPFKVLVCSKIDKGNTKLIISFKEVEYVDSSFLGALVAILKKLISSEGKLVLVFLNQDIKHLFTLTRLDKVFVVEDNTESALKHF